ncbi:uncharacterized protein F5147DRAFT_775289 [Suillus discolor]|uniref:Uncharacterized protein n=1 Tax=Suillus discolor TaxID=1912936 RepID=A0A9P7F358_9AGAM|nr:uncharacterized protein F5147DRAFT_775289 [Suillus discolor]KAG2105515.1 hypothetical protein F5147DRAFT_775289 [Suillus discolor]
MLTDDLRKDHRVQIQSRLLSVASNSSPLENIVQLISAAVIIFEHSFDIFDKRRYLQDEESDPSFYVALEQYMASPHAAAVREAVNTAVHAYEEAVATAVQAYEEAMRTAVFPYQGRLSAWMAKLPFKRFKRKAQEAFEHSQEAKQSFECSQAKEKESSCT